MLKEVLLMVSNVLEYFNGFLLILIITCVFQIFFTAVAIRKIVLHITHDNELIIRITYKNTIIAFETIYHQKNSYSFLMKSMNIFYFSHCPHSHWFFALFCCHLVRIASWSRSLCLHPHPRRTFYPWKYIISLEESYFPYLSRIRKLFGLTWAEKRGFEFHAHSTIFKAQRRHRNSYSELNSHPWKKLY